jgi:hypothetical protein
MLADSVSQSALESCMIQRLSIQRYRRLSLRVMLITSWNNAGNESHVISSSFCAMFDLVRVRRGPFPQQWLSARYCKSCLVDFKLDGWHSLIGFPSCTSSNRVGRVFEDILQSACFPLDKHCLIHLSTNANDSSEPLWLGISKAVPIVGQGDRQPELL